MTSEAAAHVREIEVEGFSFLGMSWKKVMMWIFIITDGLLFAGFLASSASQTLKRSTPGRKDAKVAPGQAWRRGKTCR